MNPIPLVDLKAAHAEVEAEVREGFERVMAGTAFIGGAEVAAFEREYAAFSGARHCVGVANGTDALELALRAVGVGPGDEVVLPANTFIATAEAVARAGGVPVLVDCDPATYLIDVDAAVAAVGPATRAVVPVHLYGRLAPADALAAALAGSGVHVVEDAAQSHGVVGPGAGAGAIAATSFYPGKNLGAYGDAGAVTTDDEELAVTVRTLGAHGGLTKYLHELVGCNSRLDALQAVVLRAKLSRLARWNDARRAAAERYDELLDGIDGVLRPQAGPHAGHVWHLYVVQVAPGNDADAASDVGPGFRDEVLAAMAAEGVGAGIHYPTPIHLTPAFAHLKYERGAFPHSEAAADRIISLPLHPHITAEQQARVAAALARAVESSRGRIGG